MGRLMRVNYTMTTGTRPDGEAYAEAAFSSECESADDFSRILGIVTEDLERRAIEYSFQPTDEPFGSLSVPASAREHLERLLCLANSAKRLETDHLESIKRASALSVYSDNYPAGRDGERFSPVGQLVDLAKKKEDVRATRELSVLLAEFASFHPNYRDPDAVVIAPSRKKLALHCGDAVAAELGVPAIRLEVPESDQIPKAKGFRKPNQRLLQASDIVLADTTPRSSVLLIDDVWDSGNTMEACAKACFQQLSSERVCVIVAAKAYPVGLKAHPGPQ